MSQGRLAGVAGMSITTLREYEDDVEKPHSAATDFKLTRALDWPPDAIELIRGGEDPDQFASATAGDGAGELAAILGKLNELADTAATVVARVEAIEQRLLQTEHRLLQAERQPR